MNIDLIQEEDDKIIVSIEENKLVNTNTTLLQKWYPYQNNMMTLLDVTRESGYINYTLLGRGYEKFKDKNWSFLDKLNIAYDLIKYKYLNDEGFVVCLSDENLYIERNNSVVLLFIMHYDLYRVHNQNTQLFAIQLKARVLSLFSKYSFQEIIDSNFSLKFTTDFEREIVKCDSTEMLKELISTEIEEQYLMLQTEYIHIPRKARRSNQVFIIFLLFTLISTLITIGYLQTIVVRNFKFESELYAEFVKGDYYKVIEIAREQELSDDSKYIVAYSSIANSSLDSTSKDSVFEAIQQSPSDSMLEYWINIGFEEYIEAIANAKILENDEYQLYALTLAEEKLINDSSRGGLDKEQEINELRKEIELLEEKKSEMS